MINLREEADFYAPKEREWDRGKPPRSPVRRGRSPEPRAQVASLVSKVVRPALRPARDARRRSRSLEEPEGRRAVASRAQLPPRPSRASGREQEGAARAMGKAMQEAGDRGLVRRREEAREREERGRRPPRLSPEDSRYSEELRRRHEAVERMVAREGRVRREI